MHTQLQRFYWFNKQVQNLKIVYKGVLSLTHPYYTSDALNHVFNSCMVDIQAKIQLRFRSDL